MTQTKNKIDIVDFSEENKHLIKSLNYEWLQKYFQVEPSDERQLSDPQNEIIAKGGMIFYVALNDEIVATASLLKVDEQTFELGKMATTEKVQGMGIGNRLIEHCIAEATRVGASRIILYSNTKLKPAIHLYKKFGFKEIPLQHSNYVRSDIKMEKLL